jgi:DNA processing protein
MPTSSNESAVLALALLATEGVGRVSAGRLLERFPDADRLLATPREQILLRLPGIPGAEAIVRRLLDGDFAARLAEARSQVASLAERQVSLLTQHHPHWPSGLDDLARGDRPTVLYAYGQTALLRRPTVALLAQPPLEGAAFERAQGLIRFLLAHGAVPAAGLQHGFDIVLCKLAAAAASPAAAFAASGLARVPGAVRPAGAALANAGGVMVSSFAMDHGPFPHDDVERARVLAAAAHAVVFVGAPEGSAERRALAWALEHGRPTFVMPESGQAGSPETRALTDAEQFDAVLAASRERAA